MSVSISGALIVCVCVEGGCMHLLHLHSQSHPHRSSCLLCVSSFKSYPRPLLASLDEREKGQIGCGRRRCWWWGRCCYSMMMMMSYTQPAHRVRGDTQTNTGCRVFSYQFCLKKIKDAYQKGKQALKDDEPKYLFSRCLSYFKYTTADYSVCK